MGGLVRVGNRVWNVVGRQKEQVVDKKVMEKAIGNREGWASAAVSSRDMKVSGRD
jgi:hypothetical protein